MDWAGAMIDGGRVSDGSARAQIMAMRYDPDTSALMAAELASDNKQDLAVTLGREPDATELYLAHFLGSAGAQQFLTALQSDPGQSAAAVLPKAAAANRSIFFAAGGAPRTVAGVMDLLRAKVSNAMEDGGVYPMPQLSRETAQLAAFQPQPEVAGGPIARQFAAARHEMSGPARRSMADTLRTAFAVSDGDGGASVPAHVRNAYGQLQKFGL